MSMPWLPFGTVYGTLLNFRAELDALGALMDAPPYKGAPKAPVLYIKTANTWTPHGRSITLPPHVQQVEVGATIAMVMASANTVGGYVLMNDLSLPHDGASGGFFRPPVKYRCLDGFLGIGPALRAVAEAGDPSQFTLEVRINDEVRQRVNFAGLLRNAATLLRDVSDFMTLRAGDVLMLGCDLGRPMARAGDRIDIVSPGFATMTHTLVAEGAA
ncbi:MAG: fumarylacetoacetate hydrolase [Betaproteobacteria bacterium]|nr:fumarylacetoacetate hydrolase [Betaproteobacteria bacterium]